MGDRINNISGGDNNNKYMEIKSQICSLELAQKLKKLGVKSYQREIKFRVYNKNWAMLVEDKDITMLDFKFPTVEFKLKTQDGQMHDQLWEDCLEDLIFMQYIGLKDKNGVEIYEGDIIDDGYYHRRSVVEYGEQSISHDWCSVGFFLSDTIHGDIHGVYERSGEIIGNIYQNPELLK